MDSDYKIINGILEWSNRTEWLYPTADKNTINWPFREGSTDVEAALKGAAPFLTQKRTCVQAGACIGIWPMRLSQEFDRVITFEAQDVNFKCALHNIEGIQNISIHNAALGKDNTKKIKMHQEGKFVDHSGAWWVVPGGDIPTICIDDLGLTEVDMMWLDIEGSEYDALVGASETINRCKPVIGVECREFVGRYNNGESPLTLLQKRFDYRLISRLSSGDHLLVP